MKRTFISYSIADKDRFVVSKLSSELQKRGMVVTTSQSFFSNPLDFTTKRNIEIADLFIGVITDESSETRVLLEWQFAVQRKVPNLLVVENTLRIENVNQENVIYFDRHNLAAAIESVHQRAVTSEKSQSSDDLVKWVLGGAAVIALLSLLNRD